MLTMYSPHPGSGLTKTEWYNNIKAMYYYNYYYREQYFIGLTLLFNDFSIQCFKYKNQELMLSCITLEHRNIVYEVHSTTLMKLLTSKNKIERQLFYNLYNSI